MEKERFNEILQSFFKALKQKTLLIIIDSASKYDKAVFSMVAFKKKNDGFNGYEDFAPLLKEIGFKNYRNERSLFVTHCAGRFSLYTLDNIGNELRRMGVTLPKGWYDWIQNQNCI